MQKSAEKKRPEINAYMTVVIETLLFTDTYSLAYTCGYTKFVSLLPGKRGRGQGGLMCLATLPAS